MRSLIGIFVAIFLLAAPAAAQPTGRFSLAVSGGVQPASPALSEHFTFERNVETATVDVQYPSKTGVLVDAAAAYRLWKQIGVGVAVTYGSSSGSADIDASIPHPFVFNRMRKISGSEGGMTRIETAAHLQLQYIIPASNQVRVTLSAGPSHISLSQDVITEVHYSESYPYDTASFTRADRRRATGSAVGFNVGGDLTWMLGKSFGVGGLVRFTRASIDLDTAEGRTMSVDAGGVQAGAGIRLFF